MAAGATSRRRRWVLVLLSPLALLVVEGCLRIGGRPRGTYASYFRLLDVEAVFEGRELPALYPPNANEEVELPGLHRSRVRANSLGLRGREISRTPAPGIFRIVCIGDSVTDGMYVSDPYPWPAVLDAAYAAEGRAVEVVNVARGGSTILRQQAMLERIGLRLGPSLVVLTFVTNDLSELRFEKVRQEAMGPQAFAPPQGFGLARFVCTRTALGEWGLERWIAFRMQAPETPVPGSSDAGAGDEDVESRGLPGGADFEQNLKDFRRRFRKVDGLALDDLWSEESDALFEEYRENLKRFAATAQAAGVPVLLAFFPSYAHVYDKAPGTRIQRLLKEACAEFEVSFLDLTEAFRARRDEVLHFAPIDYHLNRKGHQVFAEALRAGIEAAGLIPR